MGVHQGQAEVGVIAASGEETVKGREVTFPGRGDTLQSHRGMVGATS